MKLLLLTVISVLGVTVCGWVVETNLNEVSPGDTNNLWVECKKNILSDNDSLNRIKILERILFLKLSSTGHKFLLAEINGNNVIKKLSRKANFTVTGDILNGNSTFLRLAWSEVGDDDAGSYSCEVSGYDAEGNLRSFVLKPKVIQLKRITMADIRAIKDEYDIIHRCLESEVTTLRSQMTRYESEMANLRSYMTRCQYQPPNATASPVATNWTTCNPVTNQPTTTPNLVTNRPTTHTPPSPADVEWPVGLTKMVGPGYPCPVSHKKDIVQSKCHDFSDFTVFIESTNQILCYCILNVRSSYRPVWPKGNYCIEFSTYCLDGFEKEYFDGPAYSSYAVCCRTDGHPTWEVNLPTKYPFYLYTNKIGICQAVKGMKVTQTREYYITKPGKKYTTVKKMFRDSPKLCYYVPK